MPIQTIKVYGLTGTKGLLVRSHKTLCHTVAQDQSSGSLHITIYYIYLLHIVSFHVIAYCSIFSQNVDMYY